MPCAAASPLCSTFVATHARGHQAPLGPGGPQSAACPGPAGGGWSNAARPAPPCGPGTHTPSRLAQHIELRGERPEFLCAAGPPIPPARESWRGGPRTSLHPPPAPPSGGKKRPSGRRPRGSRPLVRCWPYAASPRHSSPLLAPQRRSCDPGATQASHELPSTAPGRKVARRGGKSLQRTLAIGSRQGCGLSAPHWREITTMWGFMGSAVIRSAIRPCQFAAVPLGAVKACPASPRTITQPHSTTTVSQRGPGPDRRGHITAVDTSHSRPEASTPLPPVGHSLEATGTHPMNP